MEKQIFEFSKLRTWDYLSLMLYLVFTLYIHYTFTRSSLPNFASEIIFGYSFGTIMFNYMFNYKSLRNMTVFIIWLVFGIYHFWLFQQIEESRELYFETVHAGNTLRFSILILVFQQLIRFTYIKLTNMEIIAPSIGGGKDFFDNREQNILDYAFFVLYMFVIVLLMFL